METSTAICRGVRIRNGTVTGFGNGIDIWRADASISGVRLDHNRIGFSSMQMKSLSVADTVASGPPLRPNSGEGH